MKALNENYVLMNGEQKTIFDIINCDTEPIVFRIRSY